MGAEVEFVHLPMLRDLDDADRGFLDGSALRTEIAIREYKHLIAIEVPLGFYSLAAFTTKPGIRIACPEDMKGLAVGVVRGSLASARFCERHSIQSYSFKDMKLAFDMLAESRVDAVLTGFFQGAMYCEERGLDVQRSSILYREPLYHVLNARHRDLASKLTAVFKGMQEDGTIRRITSSVFKLPEKQGDCR